MKTKSTLFSAMIAALFYLNSFAQCPASISASAVTSNASCPSNGSVTITTSPAANPSYLYTLTAGPSGSLLNVAQSSNTFNALLAGSYTARVSCGAVQADVNFTITDSYTPLSNVHAAASANCSGFAKSGTITISASGGTAPLTYSVIPSNDPNYPDALSDYSSSSTKTVNSYGTYQVRVKDACNQFYTVTTQLTPSVNSLSMHLYPHNLAGCSPSSYKFYYGLAYEATDAFYDPTAYNALGGVKINFYEKAAGSCAKTGPVLYSFISQGNWQNDTITLPAISSKNYVWEVITPCGDTIKDCFDLTEAENPYFSLQASVQGCGTAGNPYYEKIYPLNTGAGIVYPLTIKLYSGTNAAGTLVATKIVNTANDISSLAFTGLTPGTYYMQSTDACGNVNSGIIDNPTGVAPALNFLWFGTNQCTPAGVSTVSGTSTPVFAINGFIPDFSTSTSTLTIISGPSGIGQNAVYDNGRAIWINLLPGNYVAVANTTCGTTNIAFTVPSNTTTALRQSITATSESTCGGGSGTITASIDYNGGYAVSYVLVNSNNNVPADSNSNGLFSNILPGSYYIKMKLSLPGGCANSPQSYYVNSNTVNIAASASGPQIYKKIGITCEDVNGSLLPTGTAYISLVGGTPLLVEYKLTSSSTWNTYSSNAPFETAISGLVAGNIYDIRVTSCGITNATQVTIGQAAPIHITNTQQPCVGNAYELALPQISGATYEWRNPAGIIVSTAYNYTIPNYTASYNGKYTGTMVWGGCIKRTDSITLNSINCGSVITLPVKLSSFMAVTQNCAIALNWVASEEVNAKAYIIERSYDGKAFNNINRINTSGAGYYSFTDNTSQQGTVYYRLRMEDEDGLFLYSKTLTVKAKCNSIGTQWSVQPTLVKTGNAPVIKLYTSGNASFADIIVTSSTGQQVYKSHNRMETGLNNYTIPVSQFTPGIYFITVYDNHGQRTGKVEKFILAE